MRAALAPTPFAPSEPWTVGSDGAVLPAMVYGMASTHSTPQESDRSKEDRLRMRCLPYHLSGLLRIFGRQGEFRETTALGVGVPGQDVAHRG